MSWKSASGLPKAVRARAHAAASSSARRANPSAAAPTVERNTSSVASATLSPAPASPTRASAGTRHPSNSRVASGCGAMTRMRSDTRSPGLSASTTKAANPRSPASG